MSVRKLIAVASLVLITSVAAPSKASADWLFTPFVGWNWGGSANFLGLDDFDDQFEQRFNYGASLGWMGAGIVGFEADFGYTPNFFENTAGSGNFQYGHNNVTTLMGNLLIGAPIGGQHGPGFRPYAVGGVGLIKSRIGDPGDFIHVDANDWGFNVGAGAILFFSDRFGLRGDVRYFRSLEDNEPDNEFDVAFGNFRFWRGTIGATIRF